MSLPVYEFTLEASKTLTIRGLGFMLCEVMLVIRIPNALNITISSRNVIDSTLQHILLNNTSCPWHVSTDSYRVIAYKNQTDISQQLKARGGE